MLLAPLPLSQTVTPSLTPSPLERDVLYGRPLNHKPTLLTMHRPCMGHSSGSLLYKEIRDTASRGNILTNFRRSVFELHQSVIHPTIHLIVTPLPLQRLRQMTDDTMDHPEVMTDCIQTYLSCHCLVVVHY